MSHEIEADYIADWSNEGTQCRDCTSFSLRNGRSYCDEAKGEISPDGHCDYFKSKD